MRKKVGLVCLLALVWSLGSMFAYAANAWRCEINDGDWNVMQNWSLGRIPLSSDDVVIDCPLPVRVRVIGNATAANILNRNTLEIASTGLLSFGYVYTLTNEGTLQLSGTAIGTFQNAGTFNWLGGEINTFNFQNAGTLSLDGTGDRFFNGGDLTNTGMIVHADGPLRIGGNLINNSLYDFQAGTITTGNLNNSSTGVLHKSSPNTATLGNAFNNSGGLIEVLEGTLVFTGAGTSNGGTYTVAEGSNLVYRGTPTLTGTHSGVIEGSLRQESGTIYLRDPAATFNFTGTGFQWVSGTLDYYNFRNNGLITVMGTDDHLFSGGEATNTGMIVHMDGPVRITGNLGNNSLYDFQAGTISVGSLSNSSTGIFRKSSPSTNTVSATFNNSGGLIEVLEGTLVFTGAGTSNGGTYTVAADSNLVYRGTPTLTGTHSGVIEGSLRQESGTIYLRDPAATFNFTGTGFQWVSGTLDYYNFRNNGLITVMGTGDHLFNGGEATNAGIIAVGAGALLRVIGNYIQTAEGTLAPTLGGTAITQYGRLTISGQAQLTGDLAPSLDPSFTPNLGNEFVIMTYNQLTGTFGTCSGCDLGGLTLNQVYETGQLKLVVVP